MLSTACKLSPKKKSPLVLLIGIGPVALSKTHCTGKENYELQVCGCERAGHANIC